MKKIIRWGVCALTVFDLPLLILIVLLSTVGMVLMHSAVGGADDRFLDQLRNYALAFALMWVFALIPLKVYEKTAPWVYLLGVVLLMLVIFFGITSKGATRWLSLGFTRVQPSEMMKIAVPLMLTYYFSNKKGVVGFLDFIVAGILLFVPFTLIALQPDLGTALLVFVAGFGVVYFAGLSFWLLMPIVASLSVGIVLLIWYQDIICAADFDWVFLHDYQKHRVCTLLDPSTDPLGKGFHTIQSMIAIGSGGIYGKGYMMGTQAHLDFIPERTTDFIFAVFAEEFGLYGGIMLIVLYSLLIIRGLSIAASAQSNFARLLAGSLSVMIFAYVFVNIGMVTGVLPVVGVPLPFLSYGGTALIILGIASGMLMSVHNYRPNDSN